MALIDVPEFYGLLRCDTFRMAVRDRLVATRSSLVSRQRNGSRSRHPRPDPA
ncbi:MAG: hypothetical protein M3R01_11335 [Actinomycetota bacterium]|nr:hypothetical protein [Acidimicrobiia bacterium]MDQ3147501.1 hypothetical protein [Actinomycetota bacterium]